MTKDHPWNMIRIKGNIGKDGEIRATSNGGFVSKSSLGHWQGKERPTLWLNITMFEKFEFNKGDKVVIEGQLYFEEYKRNDGTTGTSWGIYADNVYPEGEEEEL
jgi:single-stranded DNA-binding protein